MIVIVKAYHVPTFFTKSSEKHIIVWDYTDRFGDRYIYEYWVRKAKTFTEFKVHFRDGDNPPVYYAAVTFTWPEQRRLPENIEEEVIHWTTRNIPGEAVSTWLLDVRSGGIREIASLHEFFEMYSLDSIDPRKEPEKALEKLRAIVLMLHGRTIDLAKYQWLKKQGMFPEVTTKYNAIEKYIELLADDITTKALEHPEKYIDFHYDGKPGEYWTADRVEHWLTDSLYI